jgi:signal transduction histidine kinase
VIRAEADVALSSPREAAEYRDALTRIQGESQRLRQLVDDMLWLARFDSRPPPRATRVSLSVEDSGPGIPPDERPRLFDRFHRVTEHGVTNHGPGAGLGLAIGDSIVRSTGGKSAVWNSPGMTPGS